LGLVILLGVTACASPSLPPQKAIVGQWVNAQGGTIYFYEDNSGFIPGAEGQTPEIPSSKFTYYFKDDTHLGIVMGGESAIVVEIKIEGDKMTWLNRLNGVEYTYTRVK